MFSSLLKSVSLYSTVVPLPPGITYGLYALLSFGFLIGTSFNQVLRAGYAYRSNVNCYPTRWSFYSQNWDTIIIRVFYGYLAFYAWSLHPDWVSLIAKSCGVAEGVSNWLTFPVTLATSIGFGFGIDVLLDSTQSLIASKPYLSFLNIFIRGRIPTYNPRVVDTKLLAQDVKDAKNLQVDRDKEDKVIQDKIDK